LRRKDFFSFQLGWELNRKLLTPVPSRYGRFLLCVDMRKNFPLGGALRQSA